MPMSLKKKLPIGLQSFDRLIEEDFMYIDKTRAIYELISTGLYFFLSRPRRFGKTLLVTTLAELFKGNRSLFDGLAISSTDYNWQEHPVVYISFATMAPKSSEILEAALDTRLKEIAASYEVSMDSAAPTLGMRFRSLIKSLSALNKVAVLIDEYDAAILKNIDDSEIAKGCHDVLADFFSAMKDGEVDSSLRFVFITGITKFSKTSTFSGLNNLQDLSLSTRAATLLGYTLDEIKANYKGHIDTICAQTAQSNKEVLEGITFWYNGYLFTDPQPGSQVKVYNPYSVMLYLQNQVFDNYWFDTGTPTFLMELLKKQEYPVTSIEGAKIHASKTKSYDLQDIKLIPLLWQAGYLTISSYNTATKNYTLTFPNEEVRVSFFENVMERLSSADAAEISSLVYSLSSSLKESNLKSFFELLQMFFSSVPYDIQLPYEKYYQTLFFSIMKLIGAHPKVEERTNNGRIDAVVQSADRIYIFEFKLGTEAQVALDQIEQKAYFQKYLSEGKPISLVGVAFDPEKRNVAQWIEKTLDVRIGDRNAES